MLGNASGENLFTPSFLRRLQRLTIHTRRAFLGSRQGVHVSRRRGHGLEFSDYRPYSPGDDFRHIDWGVYGRTDRLYVREFREEQDLHVLFFVDSSASMAYPEGEGKFEISRDLALALGFVALSSGDSVTFTFPGQSPTPKYIGAQSLPRAVAALRKIKPQGTFELLQEVRKALSYLRNPGKCFFISDFLFDLEEQFRILDAIRGRNFEIALIQVLAPSELKLPQDSGELRVVDSETHDTIDLSLQASSRQEYASVLASHIEGLERYCQKADIVHLLVSSNENIADVVLNRFPELGLLK